MPKQPDPNLETRSTSIRLPVDLGEDLRAVAKRECRSVSQQIIFYVRQAMAAEKAKQHRPR